MSTNSFSFDSIMNSSTIAFITQELTTEIMYFTFILSGCYIMTSHCLPQVAVAQWFKSSKVRGEPDNNRNSYMPSKCVVTEVKRRAASSDWYMSIVHPRYVMDLWDSAERKEVKEMDLMLFSTLVNAYIRLDRAETVLSLFDQMNSYGVSRTKEFFESTIRQLASKRCFGYALEALTIMEREMPDKIEATSFACAVNFCAQIGDYENGIRYFSQLEQLENPSLRAYMVIFRMLNKVGNWRLTVRILDSIKQKQILVDGFVLNQALSTLVDADQIDHVRDIIFDDFFLNIRTLISFNLYLKALSRLTTEGHFRIALDVISYLESSNDLKPNEITFNTIIDFAVKIRLDQEPWELVKRMEKAKIPRDEYTVSIMLRSLNAQPSFDKLKRTADSLQELQDINTNKIDLDRVVTMTLEHAKKLDARKVQRDLIQFARSRSLRIKARLRC
eukprot:GEMP01030291.1.p1 GENE.GEMP01030291.1~~GEMP01030291.1.p1  ORF type:complete len:445 (+),score=56.95 GEMP01030291.1:638-1972(+)